MNESIFQSHYEEMLCLMGESSPPRGGSDIERWLKKEAKRRDKARDVHKAVCLAIANKGRPADPGNPDALHEYHESIRSTAAKGMGFIASFFAGWMLRFLVSIVVEWLIGRMRAGRMAAGEMKSLREWGVSS